jgi:hypothetical protein
LSQAVGNKKYGVGSKYRHIPCADVKVFNHLEKWNTYVATAREEDANMLTKPLYT